VSKVLLIELKFSNKKLEIGILNKPITVCKISLISIALILLLVSSTASEATENDTGNATIKDNYVSSTALATTEKSASPKITETQITNSGSASDPRIYGDRIVWQDDRNGNYDI
jgi:beta propeller repeat protein